MKKIIYVIGIILIGLGLTMGRHVAIGGTGSPSKIVDHQTFIDDMGNKIVVANAYKRIISLSAVHTENIYSLEGEQRLIGVDHGSIYPARAVDLPRYTLSHDKDIDRLIHQQPDLVLITPSINKRYPRVVSRLESEGLQVVSLMPKNIDSFDYYIEKLAMLTCTKLRARELLDTYYSDLMGIRNKTASIQERKTVFVETSQKGFYTAAKGSLIYEAINIAGGQHVIERKPQIPHDPHVKVGFSAIEARQDDIDVYITLQGIRNGGGSIVSIKQQKKYEGIRAIREEKLYELRNPLINQYTFRYVIGVEEIARILYPSIVVDSVKLEGQERLTRLLFSKLVYDTLRLQVFTITSKDYYDNTKYLHTYGRYMDVSYKDEDYNIIETISMRGYLSPKRDEDGREYFDRDGGVTRAEMAQFIYLTYPMAVQQASRTIDIKDIEGHDNQRLIRKVVEQGYMSLEDGLFQPQQVCDLEELHKILRGLKDHNGGIL